MSASATSISPTLASNPHTCPRAASLTTVPITAMLAVALHICPDQNLRVPSKSTILSLLCSTTTVQRAYSIVSSQPTWSKCSAQTHQTYMELGIVPILRIRRSHGQETPNPLVQGPASQQETFRTIRTAAPICSGQDLRPRTGSGLGLLTPTSIIVSLYGVRTARRTLIPRQSWTP